MEGRAMVIDLFKRRGVERQDQIGLTTALAVPFYSISIGKPGYVCNHIGTGSRICIVPGSSGHQRRSTVLSVAIPQTPLACLQDLWTTVVIQKDPLNQKMEDMRATRHRRLCSNCCSTLDAPHPAGWRSNLHNASDVAPPAAPVQIAV